MRLLTLLAFLIFAHQVHADVGGSIGVGWSVPDDAQLETAELYDVRLRYKWVYAFASSTSPKLRKTGQTMGELDVLGYGLGVRVPVALEGRLALLLSAGYYDPDTNYDEHVKNEVVNRMLRQQFGKPSFHPDTYRYDVSGDYGLGIAVEYELHKHFAVTAGFTAVKLKEFAEFWDEDIGRHEIGVEQDCQCWWQSGSTLDLSSWYITLRAKL